ncbi:heavy metal translocating P-type ATPase [[Phormidium] sp. ETS-05]|uniref:heavy metal translocating P-type ATPase n=1 Tax=[Phormidium] sp. ETS-05 TaxID=222819 RepID=UPI0018EEF7EF|nr:heavy metal translocating P-type ATPase [[Phormidium] sp. ETS-05]
MALSATAASGNPLAPALLLVLHEVGDAIRDRTERATGRETLDLLSGLPSEVWVERDGVPERVSTEMLQPGDTVIIYPGEQIPVDGKIIRGSALIDEQKLTGEPLPVTRAEGQDVLASTLVREGQIWILVERTGDTTRAGQTIKLVQEAPVFDTRMENYAANLADKAIVPALLLSGGVWMATGSWARVASILTLDFVTGIRVSVPTAVLASLTAAARRGILIRSGRALEKLAEVDAIVFDKTGTLTRGDVVVVGVKSFGDTPPERILALAAAAEGHLKHPVAMAVVRYAEEMQVPQLTATSHSYQLGLGMRAQVESSTILVGSARFLLHEGITDFALCPLSLVTSPLPPFERGGGLGQMWVASDGKLLGVIEYKDELRPESPEVIDHLTDLDIEIHMLTGDKFLRAAAVAQELGLALENVHASVFPEQKGLVVQQLIAEGKTVAFVGDGINDAAALAHADVAVSFGDGADVARETADVVLMNSNLGSLVEAIAIAKQTQAIISQNTKVCVIPNLVALGMATTVGLNPVAATAIHNGSAIAAGVASLTPLWSPATRTIDN